MARPVNADAAATRQRILDAARRLVSDQGIGRTSIRKVAAEAGVSLATVLHYFHSKDGLYRACIEAMYEEMRELRTALQPVVVAGGAIGDVVENVVRRGFRFSVEHRAANRLLMRTVMDTGALDEARRSEEHLPFLDRMTTTLAAGMDSDPAAFRLTVQSVVHLVVRYALTDPEELALIVGTEDTDTALRAVEDHLVVVARALLGTHTQDSTP